MTGAAVRFEPSQAAAAARLAARDGLSLGAWIRRLAEREVARREGRCEACGQPLPPGGT